jgi:hypothetical protein
VLNVTNPDARYDLAARGVTHLQPQGPPSPISSTEYQKRLVACNAQLMYAVQYGDTLPPQSVIQTPAIGTIDFAQFEREAPLITGTYLLGYYQWAIRVRVLSARVTALAPTGQDVVLGLEIGGVLSNARLTIPQGTANTEATAEATFAGLYVAAGQGVRWLVVSGPIPEASAYQASLVMEVQGAAE